MLDVGCWMLAYHLTDSSGIEPSTFTKETADKAQTAARNVNTRFGRGLAWCCHLEIQRSFLGRTQLTLSLSQC